MRCVLPTLSQGGQKQGSGDCLLAKIFRVGTVGGKLDGLFRTEKLLLISGVQQLDGHQHLVSRVGVGEEHDGLQVYPHRHPAPVEIDDLGHGSFIIDAYAEGDLGAGQIVSIKRFGHVEGGPQPDGLGRQGRGSGHRLPAGIVCRRRFAVLQVPGVILPAGVGEDRQTGELIQHFLGFGGQERGQGLFLFCVCSQVKEGDQAEEKKQAFGELHTGFSFEAEVQMALQLSKVRRSGQKSRPAHSARSLACVNVGSADPPVVRDGRQIPAEFNSWFKWP